MPKSNLTLRFPKTWLCPLLVACCACTGVSSLPENGSGPGVGAAAGPAGSPGTGSPGGASGPGTGTSTGATAVTPSTELDAGRVVLRRLNKAEYNNTMRDLLGTMTTPADTFPDDNVSDGFDTVGVALNFSELLAEDMESADRALITELTARKVGDPVRSKVFVCEPTLANFATCVPQILTGFLKSAYRRPATPAEVADLTLLATSAQTASGDPIQGVGAALRDALLSPHFLFRVELGDPKSTAATTLNDYELASRLSYFIWSTMPDPTLMQAADAGKLAAGGADFDAQVSRMLADPKAAAFMTRFGSQWLSIQDVDGVAPDPVVYPAFSEAIRSSIAQETTLFFQSLIQGGLPLKTLLLADYTYVNAALANEYKLSPVPTGTAYVKTSLAGSNRVGLLTQDTFLTTQSQPDRTSPVKRGNWILQQLLCDPPPSPPPGIKPLVTPAADSMLTVRAALQQHRASPACSACHNVMDPIGLALENFDAIGVYRTTDNGQMIDPSGTLSDGTKVSGVAQLASIVANDPRFTSCIAQQLLTYSIGRSFSAPDAKAYAAGIGVPLKAGSWTDALQAVIKSKAFFTRRGEAS